MPLAYTISLCRLRLLSSPAQSKTLAPSWHSLHGQALILFQNGQILVSLPNLFISFLFSLPFGSTALSVISHYESLVFLFSLPFEPPERKLWILMKGHQPHLGHSQPNVCLPRPWNNQVRKSNLHNFTKSLKFTVLKQNASVSISYFLATLFLLKVTISALTSAMLMIDATPTGREPISVTRGTGGRTVPGQHTFHHRHT